MDRDGVEASVLFGPILPMNLADSELKNACIQAYNDWLAEFCFVAPNRLHGAGMLSKEDPVAARDEVLRLAEGGKIRQVNHLCGDFSAAMYSDPAWDQFWSAAEETGMIVSIHTGGGTRGDPDAPVARENPAPGGAFRSGQNSYLAPLTGVLSFGVLERHPNLKFVLAEAQIGWLPYAVQQMDRSYRRGMESKGGIEAGPLKMMPSEVFRRQVYATYEQDQCGLYLLDFFGEGHVMWASDYPHPASTWPYSKEIVERETAHLSADQKKAVLRDNAKALYGMNLD
jgi:predicted TIM-barrel fold metal-dependent hydrolase